MMPKETQGQLLPVELQDYYNSQAAQKKYLDALVTLAAPAPHDVVLDVGTGSGTVSFFLADRVKKIYGIDPNSNYITRNQAIAKKLLEHGELLSQARLEFLVMGAEEIEDLFSPSYFDSVVCWASVHHFADYRRALKGIHRVTKPGGKLIIWDAFFPEAVRELWQLASTVHDPTTMEHYTYFEYMEMLREAGFVPRSVLPFRHPNNLDRWLATIDKLLKEKSEDQIAREILDRHRDKPYAARYQSWLDQARAQGLKAALREDILRLDEEKRALMSLELVKDEKGQESWQFTYDTFVLLSEKEAQHERSLP
jgi:ubiquinone/menaquinone biosynthesis C-methylase UbiE